MSVTRFLRAALVAFGVGIAPPASAQLEESVPDIAEADLEAVMHWIKNMTTGARLPFCWKQSEARGAGTVPGRVADCPPTFTNTGASCGRSADTISAPSKLADCPPGYRNMGLTCYRGPSTRSKPRSWCRGECPSGYTNNGCTCGRGASTLGASHMVCPAGYHRSSITARCIVDCPAGYTNTGETCFRGAVVENMDNMTCGPSERRVLARCLPKDSTCGPGREEQAGLCYDNCKPGFHGEGPVCWQTCPAATPVGCALGCATSSEKCALTAVDQVLGPLVVAANIATLGASAPATDALKGAEAAETVTVGGVKVTRATKMGSAFITAVKKLQSIRPEGVEADATLTRTIYVARFGTKAATAKTVARVSSSLYNITSEFSNAYASDFADQTSKAISDTIDAHFAPDAAKYVKQQWGVIQLHEMAGTNGFQIATTVMTAVSLVDLTGVTGLVNAYSKPICQDAIVFPTLSASYK